jgi:hypothetical protein
VFHPWSIKIAHKRSTFLKVKPTMTLRLLSIMTGNFYMWTNHIIPTPPDMSTDLHNKMDGAISHMTMMVIAQFSMIKMVAGTMTTTAVMRFPITMITMGH